MRVGICNLSFEDPAAADSSAAVLADEFSHEHQTEIICHSKSLTREQLAAISRRKLERVAFRRVRDSPQFVTDPNDPSRRYQALREWGDELTRGYDLFINLTDRFPIFCAASRGVLALQFPRHFQPSIFRALWDEHLASYQSRLANSFYTRYWARLLWDIDCAVVYPPVATEGSSTKKDNLIVTVGRLTTARSGKQLQLVSAFAQLKDHLPQWSFTIVADLEETASDRKYFEALRAAGAAAGVEVLANISQEERFLLFNRAKLFWHAVGFSEDLDLHPERADPFSVSLIQAMAAGCVPLAKAGGGLSEVIRHNTNGYFWETLEELLDYSIMLARNESKRVRIAKVASNCACAFSPEKHFARFSKYVLPAALGSRLPPPSHPISFWKRIINSAEGLLTSRP